MNAFQFAIYRYAARLMTPDQKLMAAPLAQRADAGDPQAVLALKDLTMAVIIADYKKRQANEQCANKKL